MKTVKIRLPDATDLCLNNAIQENPWLGTIEDILWDALRAKITQLHTLYKTEIRK